MIRLPCPQCGATLKANDAFAGTVAPCPKCKTSCTIPGGSLMNPEAPTDRSDDLIIYTAQATRDLAVDAAKASSPIATAAARTTGKGLSLLARGTVATTRFIGSLRPMKQPAPPAIPVAVRAEPASVACPFCAEPIRPTAKKCKHCGEILDVTMRVRTGPSAPQYSIAPVVHITNVNTNTVIGGAQKRWSPLVAAFLSFLIPGMGQLYKGQPINAIVWFIVVAIGYVLLIVPGLVLHLCCVLGAAMGDPYR